MTLSPTMILYLILMIIQVAMCLIKNKIFGLLPICLTLVLFLITMNDDFYDIAIFQIIVCAIDLIVNCIIKKVSEKKYKTEIDKMKIKDL